MDSRGSKILLVGVSIALLLEVVLVYKLISLGDELSSIADKQRLRDEAIYTYYDKEGMVVVGVTERENGTLLVDFKDGDYRVINIQGNNKVEEVKKDKSIPDTRESK